MLSTMTISGPLNSGETFHEDVTRRCWPSYRRTSLAMGGDGQANFRFSAPDNYLQHWLNRYLGAHFEESYAGRVAFAGRVVAMYLQTAGATLYTTLDGVYNSIAVKYKTSSAAAAAVTLFAGDAASVAKFGTRRLVYDLGSTYASATTAAAVRDDLLAEIAWPRTVLESVELGADLAGTSVLAVTVRGYAESLDGLLLKSSSTTASTASAQVTAALSGAEFVTAGSIATNATSVTEEVDYLGAWQRIKAVASLRGGGLWLAGCYGGTALDYYQADLTNIAYAVEVRSRQRGRELYDVTGAELPLPLVRPGRLAFVRDVLPALPDDNAAPLRDPRNLFIESVQYSRNGLQLKGTDTSGVVQAIAIQMALDATKGMI